MARIGNGVNGGSKRRYNKPVPSSIRDTVIGDNNQSSSDDLDVEALYQAFWGADGSDVGVDKVIAQSNVKRTRASEYQWRANASGDGLVKSIISAHYVNALGIVDEARPNISVHTSKKAREEKPKGLIDFLDEEAEKVVTMLNKKLAFLAKDALVFGDGYLSIRGKQGEGITDFIYNLGSKPWCVTPYKSNIKNGDVGYAISVPVRQSLKSRMINDRNSIRTQQGKGFIKSLDYVDLFSEQQEVFVLRLDLEDGTLEAQSANDIYIDSYNPFSMEETYYQDSIHSGLLEGQKEAYDKFKGSLNASYSKKIATSIIERYIAISMNNTSVKERNTLKKQVAKLIQLADNHRKKKVEDGDGSASVITHIVPTTGDSATGSFDLTESSLDFKDDMEDVLFYAKNLIGAMKFHPQYTAFSDDSQGEREQDSVARTSEQMEEVGGNLRSAVSDMYRRALAIHFHLLGNKIIDSSIWEVEFNAVTVQSKKEQEYDRVDNLNNQSQFNDMVTNLKDLFVDDTPDNRELLIGMIKDSVPLNITDKDKFIDGIVNLVFTKEEIEEDGKSTDNNNDFGDK